MLRQIGTRKSRCKIAEVVANPIAARHLAPHYSLLATCYLGLGKMSQLFGIVANLITARHLATMMAGK